MTSDIRPNQRRREGGQTIIVAMLILGLLLVLGFVFVGIVNRNIKTTNRLQDRSIANDLSEAGIRYAHAQMLRGELGADFRGTPTQPIPIDTTNQDLSYDPDAFYLRQPARLAGGGRLPFTAGSQQQDLGGPDGLGPYFRVNFSNGRALVRVRYTQSDANLFQGTPLGPLRVPGLAKNYLIIESVGREGRVNPNDPTTLVTTTQRRVANYASAAQFQQELAAFKQSEARFADVPVTRAFVSIGIIEGAYYVTNKYRESNPVNIGVPADLNADAREGGPVADSLEQIFGSRLPVIGRTGTLEGPYPVGGSIHVNGNVLFHGTTHLYLNSALGDQVTVAGTVAADPDEGGGAQLIVDRATQAANGVWSANRITLGAADYASASPTFNTGGIVRDGLTEVDPNSRVRSVGYKTPPSLVERDPQTGTTRYVNMTRDSGVQVGGRNVGQYGFGRGVFINNASSRQMAVDAGSRLSTGAETSLITEWLTPAGDPSSTGWRGWLYNPTGAYLELNSDGFVIERDGTQPDEQWHTADGTIAGLSRVRYRVGRGTDRRLHIVNTLTPSFPNLNTINGNLTAAQFQSGPEFNGVVYFEGNVRVRGVIPTDIQMSVVSNATIYIDGSITKGVVGNAFTATYQVGSDGYTPTPTGQRLGRPSASMLMLMAKDYVTVNTTQFFGPARGQVITAKEDLTAPGSYNPIVMGAGNPEGLHMTSEFVLDPIGTPSSPADPENPSAWRPYAVNYLEHGNLSNRLPVMMLLTHTMDAGSASASFITLDLNTDLGNSAYFFPGTDNTVVPPFKNLASDFIPTAPLVVYGLGTNSYQRYSSFESISFPIIDPLVTTVTPPSAAPFNPGMLTGTGTSGSYSLYQTAPNDFRFRPTSVGGESTNDYLLGRLAMAPHDIRIEASIFAEEGSFFVIPGSWYNTNDKDTFDNYMSGLGAGSRTEASLSTTERQTLNLRRFEQFGVYPNTPFFGEPLDVRVQIFGSVSQNMPVPISVQSEMLRKWGWIPARQGSSGRFIPANHDPNGDLDTNGFVPNMTITYDPVLATGRANGFRPTSDPFDARSHTIRIDDFGRPLPPVPRLPVSPTLAYFGEVR